jgi:CubicO group peptidase (beta-lactamase class C family)
LETAANGSRLSGLRFTDPHRDPEYVHRLVAPGGDQPLPSAPRVLSCEIVGAGTVRGVEEWLRETWATSLVVVAGGSVVHEWYADGVGPETLLLGASMSKSLLAQLVDRALVSGALALTDPVTRHVPELAGSGYDGTTVLDVLTMTSGVDWVEDHRDSTSLASRLLACFPGGDSRALLREVRPEVAPGRRWTYCTADSQVLDWVRERATGTPFYQAMGALWIELACSSPASVVHDAQGVDLAGGGCSATARDWARVASHVPEQTARPAYPFTRVGRLPSSITSFAGFGRHWWPMDDDGHRVTADGSRGQFAATDRRTGAVVVKTSQWPYDDFLVDRQARDLSYLGLHALLDAASPTPPRTKESAR